MKAGMVKIAPATNASPTEAAVRVRFCSKTPPRKNGMRKSAIAITAAGMVAATVCPAFIPRYAFAAPNTAAMMMPASAAFSVNSGSFESCGTKGLNSSAVDLFALRRPPPFYRYVHHFCDMSKIPVCGNNGKRMTQGDGSDPQIVFLEAELWGLDLPPLHARSCPEVAQQRRLQIAIMYRRICVNRKH